MGKMEAKRAQKRRAILEAAERSFLSDGYSDANMDRIAAEAEVTKQTVYRYFPSKEDLFRETMKQMGARNEDRAGDHLTLDDTPEAMTRFAISFMRTHLTEQHLKTLRLLVSESTRAPEMVNAFYSVGPAGTGEQLKAFFRERLKLSEPDPWIRLWISMLFAFRVEALLGRGHPTEEQIADHARQATRTLLAGIREASGRA